MVEFHLIKFYGNVLLKIFTQKNSYSENSQKNKYNVAMDPRY